MVPAMSLSLLGAVSNYPLLDAFLTMLWFFLWIIWIIILFRVILDLFRDRGLSGLAKAAWLIFIIILPFLGVIVYLIARGSKMHERDVSAAQANEAAMRSYVQEAAGGASTADQLTQLADLHTRGVLSDDEFASEKAKLLS
jgi:ABC-type multidrug transport system fused ATPase/permease subunit